LVTSSLLVIRILQQLSSFDYSLDQHIRDHDEVIEPLPFFAVLG
jgi:hypothetical protein